MQPLICLLRPCAVCCVERPSSGADLISEAILEAEFAMRARAYLQAEQEAQEAAERARGGQGPPKDAGHS